MKAPLLLIDVPEQGVDLCERYGVYSLSQYKAGVVWELSPLQRLVRVIAHCQASHGLTPRVLVISLEGARLLLDELGEIPREVEGVPLALKEQALIPLGLFLL